MESKQHVDIITFTLRIQRGTLPSIILDDARVYASMCVPLHVYIIQTEIQTHTHYTITLTQHPINARLFNKKIMKLQ